LFELFSPSQFVSPLEVGTGRAMEPYRGPSRRSRCTAALPVVPMVPSLGRSATRCRRSMHVVYRRADWCQL